MVNIPQEKESELYKMVQAHARLTDAVTTKGLTRGDAYELLLLGEVVDQGMRFLPSSEFWNKYNSGMGLLKSYRAYRRDLEDALEDMD